MKSLPLLSLRLSLPLFAACAMHSTMADTVYVQGGGQLNGKILRKSGDTLYLHTDYAGEVHVQWSKVVAISTDSPVNLQLTDVPDGTRARLVQAPDGKVYLLPEGGRLAPAAPVPGNPALAATPPATSPSTPAIDGVPPIDAVPPIGLGKILYINPLPEETAHGVSYAGHVTFSAAHTEGNSRSQHVNGEAELDARARDYRYSLNGKVNRASEGGVLLTSNWLLGGNYDRFFDPRHFVYGRTSLERDVFKDIERRATMGAGYGLQVFDTPATQLSLRAGPDYVATRKVDGSSDNYPSLGWGVKYRHKLEDSAMEVFHEQDGFWNIHNVQEVTLRTRSGLRMPVIAKMLASVELDVDWERTPAAGRKSTDSTLLFGVGYQW